MKYKNTVIKKNIETAQAQAERLIFELESFVGH